MAEVEPRRALDKERVWPDQHISLGHFYVEDLERESQQVPKSICDRLWNAFGFNEADVFDANGQLRPT
jgi:hypothetical protein